MSAASVIRVACGGGDGEGEREKAIRELARVLTDIEARWPVDLPEFIASSIAVLREIGYMPPAEWPRPLTLVRGGLDDAEGADG